MSLVRVEAVRLLRWNSTSLASAFKITTIWFPRFSGGSRSWSSPNGRRGGRRSEGVLNSRRLSCGSLLLLGARRGLAGLR
jgi:hypothetical protein